MFDCVDSIRWHKEVLKKVIHIIFLIYICKFYQYLLIKKIVNFYLKLQTDYMNVLPQAVLTILRSCAFFDDVYALAFALHPIKKAILNLESQSCSFADCFLGLVQLGAAIKNLPENDYFTF